MSYTDSNQANEARRVLLTIDYEIFGSGAGDVRQHVIDPTERMARIADKHGVPLVIFFELEEYLLFEKYASELRADLGYDPGALMRDQARDLLRRGHDVQLHLHPQWYGAAYQKSEQGPDSAGAGRWLLHNDKLTVDALFEEAGQVNRYIEERKAGLQTVIGEAQPDHRICAYRAGGFAAQPGTRLLEALSKNGFYFESSVVHGMHHNGRHVKLDYRQAPARRHCWRIRDDVAVEKVDGPLLEIPIHSVMGRRVHQATLGRVKAKFSRNVPKDRQMEMIQELGIGWNPFNLARFLWQPVPIKLDFHNVSPSKLARWIRQAAPPAPEDLLDVVVLIGHSKEHVDDVGFEKIIKDLAQNPEVKVTTFSALASELDARSPNRTFGNLASTGFNL